MFLHSCGVSPYRTNYYDDDGGAYNDVDGHGSGGGAMNNHNNDVDDGDDVDDYSDSDDEGTGLGVGFELGLGVNWGGSGGVGCVCYEMGQRNVAMCFAVKGKREKNSKVGTDQGGNNNRGIGSKENDRKGNNHKNGDIDTS